MPVVSKYKDVRKIDEGGFAEVWSCKRESDGELFAKKKLLPNIGPDGEERFRREVRILSKLDHPNVISVVTYQLQKSPYWYIMPLYHRSLERELPTLIGDEDCIQVVFTSILDGVGYAHSEGVIHRDLNPRNVLLNSDDDLVVTDFGLGRIMDSESTRKTPSGWTMGTPFYMAPEQMTDAKNADERSDVFSLGRMLYELYTERITSAIQNTSRLPPGISIIVDRCTQQDPNDRFQSVSELKRAWLIAIGVTPGMSTYEEINEVVATLTATRRPDRDNVRWLLENLIEHQEDGDLVHETVMQLNGIIIQMMCDLNRGFAQTVIRKFVENTTSQRWGFSYTDSIAKICRSIYNKVENFEIRAEMIYCTLEVGVSHDPQIFLLRWA